MEFWEIWTAFIDIIACDGHPAFKYVHENTELKAKSASRLMEGPYFQAPTAQKETITQWRWVQAAILKTDSPVQHQLFRDLVHALKRNLFV